MEKRCNGNNHVALFYLTDLANSKMAQYVCLECDILINLDKNRDTMQNVVYRQETNMDPFSEYMRVRPRYNYLISQGLTPQDAVNKLNNIQEDNKVFTKTTKN